VIYIFFIFPVRKAPQSVLVLYGKNIQHFPYFCLLENIFFLTLVKEETYCGRYDNVDDVNIYDDVVSEAEMRLSKNG